MSNQPSVISEVLTKAEARFNAVAPSYLKYEAEAQFARQLLIGNSYLMKIALECPKSLEAAIYNIASVGLTINPAEKLCYMITRNIKVSDGKWQTRIFLEVSYMGFIRLATDSGSIKWLQANCVFQNDTFVDKGPGEKPDHIYNAFSKPEDRGVFVGVYCVAKTMDGDFLTTLMQAEEVYSVRDRSESWKKNQSGPWKTDFTEMAKKTVIRRAFKTLPRTDERRMAMLANAVELSNQNEGFEPIATSPEIRDFTGDQKAFFDQLITNNDKIGMFTFLTSIDEGVRTSLYHSFEKGSKGKYQRIVDELYKEGAARVSELVDAIHGHVAANEDFGVLENIEGLAADTLAIVRERLSIEANSFIESLQKGASNE